MDEQLRFPEQVPEDLREVFTEDIIPLLPTIFEQAIASLSPEHMKRLEELRNYESGTFNMDEVLNADWEIKEAFWDNVWGMINQPADYREDSIRSIKAMQSYEKTGDQRFLDEAIDCLERIRGHDVFETAHEQAREILRFNSGACHLRRYELTGDLADLELSIHLLERVVAETPDN